MKTLDAAFLTHLAGSRTALCSAIIITLRDGTTIEGYTDHQVELEVDSVVCKPLSGYNGKALQSKADMSVGNSEADFILDSAGIDETEVLNGRYNFAQYDFYIVKYTDPIKWAKISRGFLGEATAMNPIARIEARDLFQLLQGRQNRVFTPTCDADLGDLRCGVSLATHTVSGSITGIDEQRVAFTDSARTESLNYFSYGKLTWATGAQNAGASMEVKSSASNGAIVLVAPMAKDFATGDGYSVYRGCNRLPTTCKHVFNNLNRIRADLFMIGEVELGKFGRQ